MRTKQCKQKFCTVLLYTNAVCSSVLTFNSFVLYCTPMMYFLLYLFFMQFSSYHSPVSEMT